MRPLTAALALCGGEYRLSGVARMHERPIGDLVDALRGIGARIDYLEKPGFPPLAVHPGDIDCKSVRVRGDVSSQFLTALLMALPLAGKPARIEVEGELISKPYVEITLNVMRRFGVRRAARRLDAGSKFRHRRIGRPERFSSRAMRPRRPTSSPRARSAAGRCGWKASDATASRATCASPRCWSAWAPRSRFCPRRSRCRTRSGDCRAFDLDLNHIPDAAMTAAVLALFADGPSTLRNIASWRVKETDRLAAMATELRKLGAARGGGAGFAARSCPGSSKAGVAIDTYDDHRMAMSFSLVALGGVPVTINDPGCVAKTFPDYFEAFRSHHSSGMTTPVIAIDGPSASGKGTIAKRVAEALGFHYLESGALYRLVALLALRHDLKDEAAIAKAAARHGRGLPGGRNTP